MGEMEFEMNSGIRPAFSHRHEICYKALRLEQKNRPRGNDKHARFPTPLSTPSYKKIQIFFMM